MQTQQTPISQIISPNATPGAANRSQAPTSSAAGDFQRTLNRQIEQRQASRNMEQAQGQASAASRPASPAATPAHAQAPARETTPAQAGTEPAANKEQPSAPASEAPATSDSATAEASVPAATVPPPADPAAEMLALVGSIQLAIQPPAAKAAPELPVRASGKADGKNLATGALLAAGQGSGKAAATVIAQADSGDFADSLGLAQGKTGASVPSGKAEPGKLAIDAQLAATAKAGSAVSDAIIKEAPADLSRLAAQLQPGALQQAAAAVAVPADKLTGRVGTPAWDQQLGQKVVWMAAGGDQSATLTLNPPDLGPVQVVLTVTNDQADAAFMSAQPEVRQALEAAMPRLREMMSEAGIAFGSATVSAGTPEQQHNGERAAPGERRGNGQGGGVSGGEIAIAPAAGGRSRPSLSAVDTFA
ncbi:flagellar hook-length control protein FliK [Janthinobacterium tructae]|uniref:flagellar hook-length control protein FliK n=1 Tax=Janthinobacterium tructae TaxID=2590869 RepID=UPI002499F63D|nr:flagellar hook-length control protein FliK [Janthinobacterium tructae]MDI3293493.1 flagellar hook-length control protein FliK [Janthinobacterium tructae]